MAHSQWLFGDRYEVLDGIGSGASGSVWRARDLRTGADCALKVLRPELVRDAAAVSRFYAVVGAVGSLAHPNILGVHEVVAREGQLALASRLIPGDSLYTLLARNGPMPPAVAAQLMAQLCDALAAAHSVGVAHGDVKPSNVMVESVADGFPNVCLSDFGISWIVNDVAVPPAEYLAPELAPDEPATAASDVYAVGIMLYEVLSGHPPFIGVDPGVVRELHRGAQPTSIPGLPNPLWLPIAACLDKNPRHRPSASDLAALLRDVGPLSDPVPLPLRPEGGDEPTRVLEPPVPAPLPVPDIPTAVLDSAMIDRALAGATVAMTAMAMTTGARADGAAGPPHRPAPGRISNGQRGGGGRRRSFKAEILVGAAIVVLCVIVAELVNNSGHHVTPGGPAKIVAAPEPTDTTTVSITLTALPVASPSLSPSASPSPTPDSASPTASPSPTTTATTSQSQVSISWQCHSDLTRAGVHKTSCIGLGSDNMLYARGSFDGPSDQLQNIKVSLIDANGGAVVAATSSDCNGSTCSLVTGPFGPPPDSYFVSAGVDNSMHNESSPTITYP